MHKSDIDKNIYCNFCYKKLKITAIKCKCDKYFCKSHLAENKHNCSFDYKGYNQDLLEKINPIINGLKNKDY